MEQAEQTFARLVADRLKALNTNAFAVENAAGLPEDAVRSILRGGKKSGTTLNRAKAVCEALGLELYVGKKRGLGGFSEPGSDSVDGRQAARGGENVQIEWHQYARETGPAPICFEPNWIVENGFAPEFLRLIRPDFSHLLLLEARNTVALLATNGARRGAGSVWCFRNGFRIEVARIAFVDGDAVIMPDEKTEKTLVIPKSPSPGLQLLGQVVWSGHVWR